MAGRPDHRRSGQRDPGKVAAAQLSRRRLFTGLGAGAAGAIALGATGSVAHAQPPGSAPPDRFGRIFPNLPPFLPDTPQVINALMELGAPGGIIDANDDLAAGPVELIVDPDLSLNNPNNPTHTAGVTFFGQFLDHDMTFDTTSPLGVPTTPQDSVNIRTPALDLDSVYGAGPVGDPQLYQGDGMRLQVGSNGPFEDIPRTGNLTAILSDPRNDENEILKGFHVAFLLFHNNVVQQLQDGGFPGGPGAVFNEARRITTWHYQWLILREFLPLIVGQQLVNNILTNGRQFYVPEPGPAFIPIEFQLGYRFGHSMIRPSYRLNLDGDNGEAFFGMIFDPAGEGQADPVDLRAFGVRAPRRFVGWETFFEFDDENFRPNKMIDRALSTPLFNLPLPTIPSQDPPTSLAQRNLLRHLTWGTPSGQQIAQAMGNPVLLLTELASIGGGQALENQSPLWYYMLAEAEDLAGGLTLGPTGGRIVAEVFVGLLQLDPTSFLAADPNWQPTLGSSPGDFTTQDFLRFAGVDPASRAGDPGPVPGGCGVTFQVVDQWQDGYNVNAVVTNSSSSPISGWSVGIPLPAGHGIATAWGVTVSGSGANTTASSVFWNSNLNPGQTGHWGFVGSRPNGNQQLPSGLTCSAS